MIDRRTFTTRLAAMIAATVAAPVLACRPREHRPPATAGAASSADSEITAHHLRTMDDVIDALAATPAERERVMPAKTRHVAMLMYPGMFALDLVGPFAVLSGLMNTKVHLVWKDRDAVDATGIGMLPNMSLDDCPRDLDVLMVPGGGVGTAKMMKDRTVIDFVADRGARATYVTSVCTGSLVLAAAGLLRGYRATSHWVARDLLSNFGATPVAERVVEDRNRITAAGVSAGIDFALVVAGKMTTPLYAEALQLNIEYAPQPPYHAGTPEEAGAKITEVMRAMYVPIVQAMASAAA